MIARAFTNVHKYFSPSLRVKPAPAQDLAARRRRRCQILRELQNKLQLQISRSYKFCEGAAICKFLAAAKGAANLAPVKF